MPTFCSRRKTRSIFTATGLEGEAVAEGAKIVPKAAVSKYFSSRFQELEDAIKSIRVNGGEQIVVVGTPSIKAAGDEYFVPKIRASSNLMAFAKKYGLDLDNLHVTPASVRQKLWTVVQELTAVTAKKCSAEFLPVPDDTLEADGTLKPQYWGDDVTHANSAYGKRVVDHVADYLVGAV